MTTRLSLFVAASLGTAIVAGCQLPNKPPWANRTPTAQNPYGNQYAANQPAPGDNPFLQNGRHYTGHPGANHGVGRVHIPSAGHPVPNTGYPQNGGVLQAGYRTPTYQPPRTMPSPRFQSPQFQSPQFHPQAGPSPGPGLMPAPGNGVWQPSQPRGMSSDPSPFVQPH